MKLWKVRENIEQVLEMNEDGDFSDTLELLDLEFDDKVEQCVFAIKNYTGKASMIDAEIERLTAMKKSEQNKADRIKQYVETQMKLLGKDKVESTFFKIRLQKNPASVFITNESLVPKRFFVIPDVTPRIDKKAVAEFLKAGHALDGVELRQEKGLRIQ